MKRDYERLPIEEFGRQLIVTKDLDPVYVALTDSRFDRLLKSRWLVAYWCFYDVGVACWMSEFEDQEFWNRMSIAARNLEPAPPGGRWARGRERRHFRGQASVNAIEGLSRRYPVPEDFVAYLSKGKTCQGVMELAKEHYLFGNWISFKIADMLERVLNVPVNFTEAEVLMFKEPREAALRLYKEKARLPESAVLKDPERAVSDVVQYLLERFQVFEAPPHPGRMIGIQEIETILCKWKSHMNGFYPVGNDTLEAKETIEPWVHTSKVATAFMQSIPNEK